MPGISAMARDALEADPVRAYLTPPWMIPWEARVCPAPRASDSRRTAEYPRVRRRARVQRPTAPPPRIATSTWTSRDAIGPFLRSGESSLRAAAIPDGRLARAQRVAA